MEGGLVGVHHLALDFSNGKQVDAWIRVPFAPGAEQAGGDEADARIAVVLATEGGDEVAERSPEVWILIGRGLDERRRKGLGVGVGLAVDLQATAEKEGGGRANPGEGGLGLLKWKRGHRCLVPPCRTWTRIRKTRGGVPRGVRWSWRGRGIPHLGHRHSVVPVGRGGGG